MAILHFTSRCHPVSRTTLEFSLPPAAPDIIACAGKLPIDTAIEQLGHGYSIASQPREGASGS